MRRWLYSYEYVRGAPEQLERHLLEDLDAVLRRAFRLRADEPAVDGSVLVELPAGIAGVSKQARLRTGVAYRSGPRLLVPISWHADPGEAAFPSFEGHLELDPLSSRHAQLTLVGAYRTPFGPVGAVADMAGLRKVAESTVRHVLERVAAALPEPPAVATPATASRHWPLRVRDVMTHDPLVLDPDLPLKSAAHLLFYAEVSGAPVVGEDGRLVGVLSERDLLAKEAPKRFGFGREIADDDRRRAARTVGEACTPSVIVTVPDARLADAALSMLDHDVSRLVVVDEGRVAGILSRHDVLAALIRDDGDLHTAVEEALAERGAPAVKVDVEWGSVTLSGTVEERSTHAAVVAAARAVDGVMHVDADALEWRRDDVTPMLPVP